MRFPRRILVGVAAVLTVSTVATGCDSSPFAASVGGVVIKQTALNAELAARSQNKAYITAIDANAQSGLRVAGAAPGTYSTAWTADVLSDMVDAVIVHRYLAAHHELPGPERTAAAEAINAAAYGADWYGFPASLRTTLTDRIAELSVLYPPYASTKSFIAELYARYGTALFSRVCVRTVDVAVAGPGGSIDEAASLAAALAVQRAINRGRPSSAGVVECYSADQFSSQSRSLIRTVLSLSRGKAAAPQPNGDGYAVTAVASRTLVPATRPLLEALAVAEGEPTGSARVAVLQAGTHVKVNPQYGQWSGSARTGFRVVPNTETVAAG